MTVRSLLVRGMLVGLLAAVLALGFAELFGEPQVDRAISFETREEQARGLPPEPVLVSRDVQKSAGIATAIGLYSVAFGGFFALAFAVAYGRIGRFGPRGTAALVALGGFVVLVLVPFLKYPANPPAIGNPATIDRRTALYFGLLATSLLLALGALRLGRQLLPRLGAWNAALVAGAVYLGLIALVQLVLPVVDEVPYGFPASTLWRFRLASLGTQLVLWATLGLVFGALTERRLRVVRRPRRIRSAA
jgi:predicted cobalt transporter CbtA